MLPKIFTLDSDERTPQQLRRRSRLNVRRLAVESLEGRRLLSVSYLAMERSQSAPGQERDLHSPFSIGSSHDLKQDARHTSPGGHFGQMGQGEAHRKHELEAESEYPSAIGTRSGHIDLDGDQDDRWSFGPSTRHTLEVQRATASVAISTLTFLASIDYDDFNAAENPVRRTAASASCCDRDNDLANAFPEHDPVSDIVDRIESSSGKSQLEQDAAQQGVIWNPPSASLGHDDEPYEADSSVASSPVPALTNHPRDGMSYAHKPSSEGGLVVLDFHAFDAPASASELSYHAFPDYSPTGPFDVPLGESGRGDAQPQGAPRDSSSPSGSFDSDGIGQTNDAASGPFLGPLWSLSAVAKALTGNAFATTPQWTIVLDWPIVPRYDVWQTPTVPEHTSRADSPSSESHETVPARPLLSLSPLGTLSAKPAIDFLQQQSVGAASWQLVLGSVNLDAPSGAQIHSSSSPLGSATTWDHSQRGSWLSPAETLRFDAAYDDLGMSGQDPLALMHRSGEAWNGLGDIELYRLQTLWNQAFAEFDPEAWSSRTPQPAAPDPRLENWLRSDSYAGPDAVAVEEGGIVELAAVDRFGNSVTSLSGADRPVTAIAQLPGRQPVEMNASVGVYRRDALMGMPIAMAAAATRDTVSPAWDLPFDAEHGFVNRVITDGELRATWPATAISPDSKGSLSASSDDGEPHAVLGTLEMDASNVPHLRRAWTLLFPSAMIVTGGWLERRQRRARRE